MSGIPENALTADSTPLSPLEATQRLLALLPTLERLAVATGSRLVQNNITYVRRGLERTMHEVAKNAEQLVQERRLMAWADVHGIRGADSFQVRGTLIRMSLRWAYTIAEQHSNPYDTVNPDLPLSYADGKTAAYRAIKTLAYHFDPALHGENFRAFAEPHVVTVVRHCHEAGKLEFPDEAPFALIESYATNGKPIQAAPVAASPAPTPSPHPEPSALPLPPENTQPVAAAPRTHPPKAPAKIDPEPEQTEEQKRQRRFCRWVREEYGILIDQYQFAEAVDHMTEKFQSLAKGAANRLKIPATYRGEKKTIRREALRLLPLRIREFDPLSGQHFNQFVSDWLDQKLQEFVGKK